jgi:hypothetical protein
MDHELAVKSQACEKYLLGELSPERREAFEEHYFSCVECATQLRIAAELVGATRAILATEPTDLSKRAVTAADDVRVPRGWFPWLQPIFAIPAFAALLLVIGYQNFVTIPHWKHAAAPRVLPMFSLISANTRGDEGLVFSVAPDEPFGVYLDVPTDPAYSIYQLRLEDPSGASSLLRSLTAQEAQKTQVVIVQPGKRAGKSTIVVSGQTTSGADASSAKELARLQFTVALKN